MESYYQYDGSGQRTRKVVHKPGGIVEERLYFGSYELYREYQGNSQTGERQTVHVQDETGRIAMLETEDGHYGKEDLTRYIYSNHLQSATLELDEVGQVISYEEYHPYGTTAYQASNSAINAVAKRYRFSGKERDEESGLYYHGARYYAPWLGRWTAVDALESEYAPLSPYNYCLNNPVNYTDSTGMGPDDEKNQQPKINVKIPLQAADNLTFRSVSPAQQGVYLLPPGSLQAAAAAGEARFGRSIRNSETTLSQAPTRTAQQQAAHQRTVEHKYAQRGYNRDGSPSPLKRLEQNPTFQKATDRLVVPMIKLAVVAEIGSASGLTGNVISRGESLLPRIANFVKPSPGVNSAVNFSADLVSQAIDKGGDVQEYNLTSLGANLAGFNWLMAPLIGSAGEGSVKYGLDRTIFTGKSVEKVVQETAISAAFNKVGELTVGKTLSSPSALREAVQLYGRTGAIMTIATGNFAYGFVMNNFSTYINNTLDDVKK